MERIRRVVVGAGVQTAESLRRLGGYDGELVLLDGDEEFPYNRQPLSKELITGEPDEEDIRLPTPELVAELDVDLRLGVRACDLKFDEKLLSTTGGDLRFDARAIRAAPAATPRVVVAGGGFVGCEIAASARRLGAEVTVVEAVPALMSRVLDPLVSAPIAALDQRP